MKIAHVLLAIALSALFSGCATVNKMAFDEDSKTLDLQGKSLLLMHVHIENKYKPSFQPEVFVVHVETPNAQSKKDRQNFQVDAQGGSSGDSGNDYLVRMLIEPGSYVIRGMTGMSRSFPIVANFFAPLHQDVVAEKGKIIYLGAINATVRERIGEEFRAGAVIPLIDQSIAGYSGGTFDIEVNDNYDKDISAFKNSFAVLRDSEIEKQILPKFDRQKAQTWWEAH